MNFRASNLLAGPLHLRCVPTAEFSHPCWGDTSRALVSSSLKGTILKATVIINHWRGPFKSGRHGYDIQEAARCYVRDTPADVIAGLSEDWCFDVGREGDTLTPVAFLASPGIGTRLPVVPRQC